MPVTDYTPTVKDVAQMLRARTRNAFGDLVRDFNDETTPNAEDVTELIKLAADNVGIDIGADLDEKHWPSAKAAVVYLASANVELSYYPEQASADGSMYDKLMARYQLKIKAIQDALGEGLDGDLEPPVDEFETNWMTLGGGFPPPYYWRNEQW